MLVAHIAGLPAEELLPAMVGFSGAAGLVAYALRDAVRSGRLWASRRPARLPRGNPETGARDGLAAAAPRNASPYGGPNHPQGEPWDTQS